MPVTMSVTRTEKGGSGNASTTAPASTKTGFLQSISKDSPYYEDAQKILEDRRSKEESENRKKGQQNAKYFSENIQPFVKTYDYVTGYIGNGIGNWSNQQKVNDYIGMYDSLSENYKKLQDAFVGNDYLRESMSEEDYKKASEAMDAIGKALEDGTAYVRQVGEVYGQFGNADEYNRHVQLSGMSADDLQKQRDALDASREAKKQGMTTLTSSREQKKALDQLEEERPAYDAERALLTSYLNNAKYNEGVKKYGVDPKNMTYSEIMGIVNSQAAYRRNPDVYDFVRSFYDSQNENYWYGKKAEEFVDGLDAHERYLYKTVADLLGTNGSAGVSASGAAPARVSNTAKVNELTKEISERTGESEDVVKQNIQMAQWVFDAQNRAEQQEKISEYVSANAGNAALANAGSVLINLPAGVAAFLDQTGQTIGNKLNGTDAPVNPNTPGQSLLNVSNDIRDATRKQIEKKVSAKLPTGANLGVFAYDTLMNTADVVAQTLVGGVVGRGIGSALGLGANGINKAISATTGMIASSSAAANTVQESLEDGYSNGMAVARGAIAGAIESIVEAVQIDRLLKGLAGGDSAIKAVLKGALSEGTEEVVTNILTEDLVEFFFGNGARISRLTAEYEAAGYSKEGALRKAALDVIGQDAETFVSAAITGAVFGGTEAAATRANDKANTKLAQDGINNRIGGIGEIEFLKAVNGEMVSAAEEFNRTHNDAQYKAVDDEVLRRIQYIQDVKEDIQKNSSLRNVIGESGIQQEIQKLDANVQTLSEIHSLIESGRYDPSYQAELISAKEEDLTKTTEEQAKSQRNVLKAAQMYLSAFGSEKKAVEAAKKTAVQENARATELSEERNRLTEALTTADEAQKVEINRRLQEIGREIKRTARNVIRAGKVEKALSDQYRSAINTALGGNEKQLSKKLTNVLGREVKVTYDDNAKGFSSMRTGADSSTLTVNPELILRTENELRREIEASGGVYTGNKAKEKLVHEIAHAAARTDASFTRNGMDVYRLLVDNGLITSEDIDEKATREAYESTLQGYMATESAKAEVRRLVEAGNSEADAVAAVREEYIGEELVAQMLEWMERATNGQLSREILGEKRNVFVQALNRIAEIFRSVAAKLKGVDNVNAAKTAGFADKIERFAREFAERGVAEMNEGKAAVSQESAGATQSADNAHGNSGEGAVASSESEPSTGTQKEDERFSLVMTRPDGIEVYETSDSVLKLPWKERKKRYLKFITKDYIGRTAKFIRNGHVYYAEFDRSNAKKAIYGDNRSDLKGFDALVNTGADGYVFELVENAKYHHSSKDRKNHASTNYFDYFVKTVQIDGSVFDVLADVKKQYNNDGGYIYTLRLVENKNVKASPKQGGQAPLKSSDNALTDNSISQNDPSVNKESVDERFSLESESERGIYAIESYAEISRKQMELNQRENELRERKREIQNNPELLRVMDEYSDLFNEMRELLPKRRKGTATQEELDRIEEIKVTRDEMTDRISKLQESIGLNAIAKEETEIREMKEALRIAADEAWEREGAEREERAIKKAGVSAEEYFRKKSIKVFKTTSNFNEAGYLLPDGKLLDFSGGERNHRYRDHREIGEIYEATNGTAALNRFLRDGNIRVMAESPGIDLASLVEPTSEQYSAIRRFINSHGLREGQFFVDFSDAEGRRSGNYSYAGRVSADRIINDIKYFYQTGETRAQSELDQFRFSLPTDSMGYKLSEEQQEFFRDSVVRDEDGRLKVMYHGTPSGDFTVFRDGTYFTENKWYADLYQNPGASSINSRKTVTNPKTYKVYLNIKKPFDIADAEARDIYINEYIKGGNAVGINPYLSDAEYAKISSIDWTEGEDLREFLIDNEYDYDGLVLDEGAVGGYGDDVKYRGKSYVIFHPEQVKDVENKTPTSSTDIRYSLSDEQRKKRQAENIAFLKKQIQRGRSYAVSPSALDKVWAELRRGYGIDKADEQTVRSMFEIVDAMSMHKMDADEGMARLNAMAREVLTNVYQVDDKLMRENEAFIQYIRSTPLSVPADNESDLGGKYGDYRNANRRYVNLSREGTPVDSVYEQICDMFPGILDRSVSHPADQIHEIVDAMRSMDPEETPVYSEVLGSAAESFVSNVMAKMDRYSRETFRSKSERDKEILRDNAERQAAAERNRSDVLRAREADEYEKRVKRMETQNRNTVNAYEARIQGIEMAAARDAVQYREIINNLQNRMDELGAKNDRRDYSDALRRDARVIRSAAVSPNQKRFIPEEYRKTIERIADFLDKVSRYNGTYRTDMADMAVYKDIQSLAPLYGDDFAQMAAYLVNEIDWTAGADMAEDRVAPMAALRVAQNAYRLGRLLRTSIARQNRMVLDGKSRNANHVAGELVDDLNNRRNVEKEFNTLEMDAKGKIRSSSDSGKYLERLEKRTRKTRKWISLNTMDGYSFLRRMGKVGDALYDTLRAAQSEQIMHVQEYVNTLQDKLLKDQQDGAKGVDLSRYIGDKQKTVTVTLSNGEKYTMTAAQAMTIVTLYEREAGKSHIENGGVRLVHPKDKTLSAAVALKAADVAAIEQKLDADDRRVMKVMNDFIREQCTEWGNEATLERYGFHRFNAQHYFPITVDRNALPSNVSAEGAKNYLQFNVQNVGFAKAADASAKAPVVIDSFISVINRHVEGMATYAAYLNAEDIVNRLMSAPGVKDAMQRSLGTGSVKYMTDMMTELKQGNRGGSEDALTQWWNKSAGHYKSAAVSYNLSTALKQPISIVRAAAVLDPKYILAAKRVPFSGTGKAAHEEMMQYSGIGVKKSVGYSDVGVSRDINAQIGYEKKDLSKKVRDVSEFGMALAGYMDEWTWDSIWIACREEVRDKKPDLAANHEAFMREVAKRFADVVAQTQVVDSPLDSSPLSRSKSPLARNVFAFTSEPIKGFNLLMNAMDDLINAEKGSIRQKQAAAQMARTAVITVVGWAAEASISAAFQMIRDEDDDEGELVKEFGVKFGKQMMSNAYNVVPYIGQLVDIVVDTWKGYDFTDMGIAPLVDVIDSANSVMDTLRNPDNKSETIVKAGRDFVESVATFFGIPIRNFNRDVVAGLRLFFHGTDWYTAEYEMQKIFYNPKSSTAREKHEFNSLLTDAYLSGNKEAFEHIYNDMRSMGLTPQTIMNGIAKDAYAQDITSSGSTLTRYTPGSDAWYIGMKGIFDRDLSAPDGLEKELTRLYKATEEKGVLPKYKSDSYTVNGEDKKMSVKDHEAVLAEYSTLYYEIATILRNSPAYKNADDTLKAYWMAQAERYAGAVSIYRVDSEYNLRTKWWEKMKDKPYYDVAGYILTNLKPSKEDE